MRVANRVITLIAALSLSAGVALIGPAAASADRSQYDLEKSQLASLDDALNKVIKKLEAGELKGKALEEAATKIQYRWQSVIGDLKSWGSLFGSSPGDL